MSLSICSTNAWANEFECFSELVHMFPLNDEYLYFGVGFNTAANKHSFVWASNDKETRQYTHKNRF